MVWVVGLVLEAVGRVRARRRACSDMGIRGIVVLLW
jgi:hypothetical protein